jgi:LacI family transcriptional regulator
MAIPKLSDIAAATGVHEMTVSRALRNVGRMRAETRQRVLDAARQLGYRPNAAASAMRTGHTGCVGLLTVAQSGQGTAPLAPAALVGMLEVVSRRGGFIAHALWSDAANADDVATLPPILGRRVAEGLLMQGVPARPGRFDAFLERNRLPAVWLNQQRPTNAVCLDDRGAARKVIEQLLAQGHRRIAELRRPESGASHACRERSAGYEQTMRQAGLAPAGLSFSSAGTGGLRELADALRDPARRPTAIVAAEEGSAVWACLLDLGIRVPQEISLVAFSEDFPRTADRWVSTVRAPLDAMGRKAADMLWRLMDAGIGSMPSICLPYGEIDSLRTVGLVGRI